MNTYFFQIKPVTPDAMTGKKRRTSIIVEAGFLDKVKTIADYAEQAKLTIHVKQGFAPDASSSLLQQASETLFSASLFKNNAPYNTEQAWVYI